MKKNLLMAILLLTIFAAPAALSQSNCTLVGWASQNGGTTGGGLATPTVVSNYAAFKAAVENENVKVVHISGRITFPAAGRINFQDQTGKTIYGLPGSKLVSSDITASGSGILYVKRLSNVIFRNISFEGPGAYDRDGNDNMTIDNCTNIWVDHCDFQDGLDGNLDIKNMADYISITWCRFIYLKPPIAGGSGGADDHRFSNLFGSSDGATGDRGKLRITMQNNWWAQGCKERMPRVRFGKIHLVNNYFSAAGNNHCIRAGFEADLRIESNYFENVNNPIDLFENNSTAVSSINNLFINTTGTNAGRGTAFTPPYSLTITAAANVKSQVTGGAGATLTSPNCSGGSGTTTYSLTTISSPPSGGNVSGAGSYASGSVATVTATPIAGYTFTGWSGDASGTTNPLSVTMSATKTVTANFTAVNVGTYTLTTSASPSAGGTVTRSPNAASYSPGTIVNLTATAAPGYSFAGWSVDGSGVANPLSVTMNSNKSVTASFQPTTTNAQTIYVSPTGSASSPGTSITLPTTLQNALATISAGGTIFMRGGTYNLSTTILIAETNSGTSGNTKKVFAYAGEAPVVNFSAMAVISSNRGIVLDGSYWHFKGIIIEGAGDNGMLLSGDNNIIESCVFRKNKDTGLQLSRYNTSYNTIAQWPGNNLILACEAYDNADPDSEDADGFAAKLTSGNGNVFRNCISHHNIDDGWDLYTKSDTGPIGAITLEGCISHSNGTLTTGGSSGNGDKNGFKLGGEDIAVNHIVRRCIAFNNGKHGFTYNRNSGSLQITNNTAYNNGERNFNFDGGSSVFRNNLSFDGGSSTDRIVGNSSAPNAFAGLASAFTITSADFVTLNPGSNASPLANGFLNLASASDAINGGVVTPGITYNGSAPDLGALESGGATPANYTLTATASPAAGGTISRSPNATSYAAGTVVTVTAIPAAGYTFIGWSGGASGSSNPITVTINSNTTITANFTAAASTYALITSASPAVGGTVGRSPNASSYTSGSVVSLTAAPASGYIFSGWSGDATGTANPLSVTMSANKSVTAIFTVVSTNTTLHIEDNSTTTSGYCGAEGSRQNTYTGASGGYYINVSNASGKGINWSVQAGAAGTYTLVWRYANAGSQSATSARVLVNGSPAINNVAFPKTASWNTWTNTANVTVTLVAGANTIRLETTSSNEFAVIDWIEITGSNPVAGACSSPVSVNSIKATSAETMSDFDVAFKPMLFPNPVKQTKATLRFFSDKSQQIKIDILTIDGKLVKNAANRQFTVGTHYVEIGNSTIKPGFYFVVISNKNGEKTTMPMMLQ